MIGVVQAAHQYCQIGNDKAEQGQDSDYDSRSIEYGIQKTDDDGRSYCQEQIKPPVLGTGGTSAESSVLFS